MSFVRNSIGGTSIPPLVIDTKLVRESVTLVNPLG